MKFDDVVMATVSLVLVGLILDAFLLVALIPVASSSTGDLAAVIAFLIASLAVGYLFASKIQEESRIRAIEVIVVLTAFTMLIFESIWIANSFAGAYIREHLNGLFNTNGWTNYDWDAYAAFLVSVAVIIISAVSFIGLYAGSMLKSPKKS